MDYPEEVMLEAARFVGRSVKPVARAKEGSGGRLPFGSAFAIEHFGNYAIVSAAHVVNGPGARYVGLSEKVTVRWPLEYARIRAVREDYADPDVATARFQVTQPDLPGLADAIPLSVAAPDHVALLGQTYLAVGQPVSKSKMRHNPRSLRAATAFLTGESVPDAELSAIGLDRRVHLAMVYDRHALDWRPPGSGAGPLPNGMSGGPLFVVERGGDGRLRFPLVGVLNAFRKGPPEVLVATRIGAVLDHLAPFRQARAREFVSVSTRP